MQAHKSLINAPISQNVPVDGLMLRMNRRGYELLTPYRLQRKPWGNARKSQFISNLLHGLPTGMLIFNTIDDLTTVIDGAERLVALQEFTSGALHVHRGYLPDAVAVEHDGELIVFGDLSERAQREIMHLTIPVQQYKVDALTERSVRAVVEQG